MGHDHPSIYIYESKDAGRLYDSYLWWYDHALYGVISYHPTFDDGAFADVA